MMELILLAAVAAPAAGLEPHVKYPTENTLFDCDLREAADARLPVKAWSPRNESVARFAWLLHGSRRPSMQYEGSWSVFHDDGVYSTLVEWPRRAVLGSSRLTDGKTLRRDEATFEIDRTKHSAHAVVVNFEAPAEDNERWSPVGGYFGDCRLIEGREAIRHFEDMQ